MACEERGDGNLGDPADSLGEYLPVGADSRR